MSERRSWTPAEVAVVALIALVVALMIYLGLRGTLFLVPKYVEEHYVCYYMDGPSVVEVRLDCPLRHEAYADFLSPKLMASAPKCTVVGRQAFPLDSLVATAANATIRAVRLPSGAYALETANGTAQAFCFRG